MDDERRALTRSGLRWQIGIGVLLIVTVLAMLVAVDRLSRSQALSRWTDRIQYSFFERGKQMFLNRGNFLEFEDRLILEELPATDHSRGGVFFLGSSNLKWGLKLWELPDEQRALVHNYGIGATNHTSQLHFTRFLFEVRGLIHAPAERTFFVLGLSQQSAFMTDSAYFEALWGRYGIYRYDRKRGISLVERPRLAAAFVAEKARLVSFIGGVLNQTGRVLAARFGLPLAPGAGETSEPALERMATALEVADPDARMADQLGELERLLDYLRERRVKVDLVQLPERTVVRRKSLPRAYREALAGIARSRGLRFVDLSDLLRDEEFLDLNHANAAGLPKIHAALMAMAEEHLARRPGSSTASP